MHGFLLEGCDDEESGKHDSDEDDNMQDVDYAEAILQATEVRKSARLNTYKSKYRSMLHIESQSNICERLFSRAKPIMTPQRKNMHPYRLESLLFLWYNFFLWSVTTVQDAIREDPDTEEATS